MLDGRGDCTMNARVSMLAHEISSMPDMVIEWLRRRRSGIGRRPKFDAIARPPGSANFPSGRTHRVKKPANLKLEAIAFPGQRLSRGKNLCGSRTGPASSLVHIDNISGDLGGTLCCLLDIAGNFLRCAALLVDRGRGRGREVPNA